MNIELKNFGPIEYLNINFDKNLHLVYGKNAIGKSYAIYCIYCLLKSIKGKNSGYNQRIFSMVDTKEIEYADLLKYLEIEDFDLTNSESVTKFYVERIAKDLRESVLKEFQNSLLNTFSSIKNLKNRYNNKNFEIIINIPQSEICKKITIFSKDSENLDFHIELSNKNLELTKKNKGKKKFEIFINENKTIVANSEEELIVKVFAFIYSQLDGIYHELNAGMKEVYFLPASRSGLYQALNSFAPIIAELAQNRFFTKSKKIELPALSEPLSDYFLDLSTIDRKYDNKEFQSFVNKLEETILKGKVDFNEKTKNITYKPRFC